MTIVAALFALLSLALLVALVLLERQHAAERERTHTSHREERAQLINKIASPQTPMQTGRPIPKVAQRRSPETARDYAQVGTVARPRDPEE